MIGDNLEVEVVPFSFYFTDGGEEIRGAAHAFSCSLTDKIVKLIERNEI